MPIKHTDFIIKGMHRDLSESAFNPEFAYENHNIRITTDKNSSSEHTGDMFALTNERGNKYTPIIGLESDDMQGIPIGQCKLNDYWVVFYTGEEESFNDKIYKLWIEDDRLHGELLYCGNLGFDYRYPIEAFGYYENENVQKVYWTDGINQPRFINIVEKEEKRSIWNDKSFDFVPEINLVGHRVTVNENNTGGKFPAGVIQWFFTYSRQFGQETAIFEATKLYELKFSDRGAAPDEQTNQSFEIILTGLDTNFDFVNIYSVIRTSLDGTPIAKCVANLPIVDGSTRFVDTNLYGYAVDPQELLYKGGEMISAYTMENKDNTLFLGNYNLRRSYIPEDVRTDIKENGIFSFQYPTSESLINKDTSSDPYFKNGNTYRFGVQFQHITGKWSEVVWIGDYECDKRIQKGYLANGSEEWYWQKPYANLKIDSSLASSMQELINLGYVRIRPVVVYPNFKERKFLCQGVWCNTLYESMREDKIYPDYFVRFLDKGETDSDLTIYGNNRTWYSKVCCYSPNWNQNLLWSELDDEYAPNIKDYVNSVKVAKNVFRCKNNVYSIYSPDMEFNDSYKVVSYDGIKISMPWFAYTLLNNRLDTEIETSTISKSIVGRPQWEDSTRAECFNNVIQEEKEIHTSNHHKGYHAVHYVGKMEIIDGENTGTTTQIVEGSRFWGYGDEYSYLLSQDNCGFAKAAKDDVATYFNYITRYPTRLNGFKPRSFRDQHYVGGYIWADNLFNIRTIHSEITDKDVPVNSASFMQLYFNYTYPVFLWQHSGSICYDNSEKDASSVLKSNKVLQEFEIALRHESNTDEFIEPKNAKAIYGRDTIKIDDNILYSMNIDSILAFTTSYTAIVDKNPDSISPRPTIKDTGKYENINYDWLFGAVQTDNGNGWSNVWNVESCKLYDVTNGKVDFNTNLIVPLFEGGLPVDHYWKNIKLGVTDDCWGFNWFDKSLETQGAPQSADVKYSSVPHLVVQIDNPTDILDKWNVSGYRRIIPIVDVEQEISDNLFGGDTDSVLQNNNFVVAGESVPIVTRTVNGDYVSVLDFSYFNVRWTIGDVRLQEYELLKTYPLTFEAENCVTEVLKVALESYWNMDCRYDTWKNNPTFATSPANWNLMNPVYNQKDNFFVYHGLDLSTNSIDNYPNSFTWTKTKWAGDLTDKWTHITLASTMDVDGNKGEITKLIKLQDNLLCFQPRGLSQILYNEREQIATGSGVPIELANSGKVSGVRYVTEQTGCNNKWSICKTESGLYWVDDENKTIMAWNQQLANLSDALGFHSWINEMSELKIWNPVDFSSFVTYNDPYNCNVMFFFKEKMLSYNTQLNCFDSFFSYGSVPYYMALNGTAFTLSNKDTFRKGTYKVWEQHKGDYNYFYVQDECEYNEYGEIITKGKYDNGQPTEFGYEPYFTTILVNPDMPYDKVFTNLDMRTDMWNKDKELLEETFSHLEVWNEFQWNKSILIRNVDIPKVHLPAQHSILKKKFRVWYVDIPRDIKHSDTRFYKRDRMRNPWLYVKLSKELIDNDDMITYPYISNNKHIIHHIGVSYFI